jgi:peptidyl-prolyl cis-trans isomerase SurA
MWDERIEIATVTVDSSAISKIPTIKKWLAKSPLTIVAAKAQKKKIPLTITRRVYHKDESLPTGLSWTANQRVDLPDGRGFVVVEKIIPPQPKTLEEARGYIIADYQDQLEKEWVASLQKKYPVKINEDVFKSLIKSR